MSYTIYEEHDGNPMLEIIVDDQIWLKFSVRNVEPNSREWLAQILERDFNIAVQVAERRERKRIADSLYELKELIDLLIGSLMIIETNAL